MSELESTQDDYENGDGGAEFTGGVANCGTPTTPPCPLQALYLERNALIYQLAGRRASREEVRRVASRVDQYLLSALRSVRVLEQSVERERDAGSDAECQVEVIEVVVK
jgi:hypothetical protein